MSTALPAIFSSFSHHKLILSRKRSLLYRLYDAGMTSREPRSKNVCYTWTALVDLKPPTYPQIYDLFYERKVRVYALESYGSWIMDKITPAARLRMVQISRNLNQKPSPSMLFDSTLQLFTEKNMSDFEVLCFV